MEISWTIRPRDLELARQNAQLLQQATGIPAHAVADGKGYAPDLDWSNVYWLDLSDD